MQIVAISSYWFFDMLKTAKRELVLVFPALHVDWLNCLESIAREKAIKLQICINNTEESIRQGHGSAAQFEMLTGLNADVRQSKNLKVQYLRCDDYAYFFFNDSLIVSEWGTGENAIQIPASEARDFEKSIFPDLAIMETVQNIQPSAPILSEPFDKDAAKEAAVALKLNPPLAPDLQRQLLVYTTRFQFVEIEFKGSKFASSKVKLPSNVLPVNDADLVRSLETTLRLFQDRSNRIFQTASDLTARLDYIKRVYLRKNPDKDKWVLDKSVKLELNAQLELLTTDIEKVKSELVDTLKTEIESTKQKLSAELISFYQSNTPPHLKLLSDHELMKALKKLAQDALLKIKFPDPKSLLGNLSLVVRYFDLTEEDLRDEILLKWFEMNGLLESQEFNQLAKWSNTFLTKE